MDQPKIDAIPIKHKLGWGVGAAGASILVNGVASMILFYLVAIVKMEPALAGGLVFGFKLLDVVTDPVMGVVSDRTVSKWGRRRPYLFVGAFVSTASILVLFNTPAFPSVGMTAADVSLGLLLYTLGYTLFNVPYVTMPAEMTDGYHERSSIHAYRVVFLSAGATLSLVLGPVLMQTYGQTRETYSLIAFIMAALIFVTMLACFYATKNVRSIGRTEGAPSFWTQLNAIGKNRHFLLIISAKAAQLIGIFATQAALFFYVLNGLQLQESALIAFGLSSTAASFLFAPILVRVSKRIGKRNAFMLSGMVYICVSMSWYLSGPGESYWLVGLRGFFMGLPFAGNILLAMSMLTDAIEYDARKYGVRREGMYTAFYSFAEKFAGAFGPLLIGVLLSAAGFNRDLDPTAAQSPQVVSALLLGIAAIPALSSLISISIIYFYRLDERELDSVRSQAPQDAQSAKT
ncbi:MAG: MFS transporter [Pseudomonadota bacterium]